jgi:hypothetical protein
MRFLEPLRSHGIFISVFVAVAFLRLLPLFDYQFTYDEISVLQRVGFRDLSSLIQGAIKVDAHPALLQVFIWYIYLGAGPLTWLIKLPFILMSLAGLIYAYLFGIRNFSKQAGIIASIFFGFALIYVYHAPIARMYCSGIFFTLGLLYHFSEVVFRKNDSLKQLFFMGLFMLLSAYNHHINALYAATVFIGGFFLLDAPRRKRYLLCGLITILCYLPMLPVTLYQLGIGGIGADQGGWLEAPRLSVFPVLLNVLCGSGFSLLIVLCLLLVSVIGGRHAGRRNLQFFLFLLFLVNFFVVFLYSVLRSAVYQHNVMLFAGCGFILVLSSLLDSRSRLVNQVIVLLLTVWLVSETYFRKDYLTQCVKTVYEYQFERTAYYKKVYGDAAVYPVFFEADSVMRRIYFAKYNSAYDCRINADLLISHGERWAVDSAGHKVSTVLLYQRFLSQLRSDYLVLACAPPLHQALARRYFPYLVENTQTQAIHYKVYSRRISDKGRVVPDDRIVFDSRSDPSSVFVGSSPLSAQGLQVNKDNEFPFSIKGPYKKAVTSEGQVVLASALIERTDSLSGVECCLSVSDPSSGKNLHYNSLAAGNFCADSTGKIIYGDIFIGNFNKECDRDDQLNVYLWNVAHEQFILRDLTFRVIDHWPLSWHFWD